MSFRPDQICWGNGNSKAVISNPLEAIFSKRVFKGKPYETALLAGEPARDFIGSALRINNQLAHSDHATAGRSILAVKYAIMDGDPIVLTRERDGHLGVTAAQPYQMKFVMPMYVALASELEILKDTEEFDDTVAQDLFNIIAEDCEFGLPFVVLAFAGAKYSSQKIQSFFIKYLGANCRENELNVGCLQIDEIVKFVRTGRYNEGNKGVSFRSREHFVRTGEFLNDLDQGVNRESNQEDNPLSKWQFNKDSVAYKRVRADFNVYPTVVLYHNGGEFLAQIFSAYLMFERPSYPFLVKDEKGNWDLRQVGNRMNEISELSSKQWDILNGAYYVRVAEEFRRESVNDSPNIMDFVRWYKEYSRTIDPNANTMVICALALIDCNFHVLAIFYALSQLKDIFRDNSDNTRLKSNWIESLNSKESLGLFIDSVRNLWRRARGARGLEHLLTAIGVNPFRI
ncbi:hypothetical protein JW962_00510 [Candidatus Dojkabacteria bacterium]|nr:hypothetical protein [Candidatus Dojkabacteria bacterium]